MRFKRSLSALVVALLLLTSAAAELFAQIEGERWTSPTYGFSVSWAGTEWQPDPEGTLTAVGPERLDRLHLLNGVSSLYFEGATRYQGDLSACVAEEANLLAQETGVSEIRPYRDEEGVQLVADGPNSSAAAFTLTLSIGDQEVELVDYVECRTLTPGQAVLIITLVTQPPGFDQELAAAQTVIDTIELPEESPLDPLAAYGGWLAAAQERPSIAGPLSGELAFGPDTLGVERAGVDAPDFYARAEFANPQPAREMWDIGLGFRDSGGEEQLRLVVDAAGTWFLKDGLGEVITGGSVVDFNTSPSGANTIELVATGDTGYFAFNERLVSELDLSARAEGGDVFVGAGFFTEDATENGTLDFTDFEIWSLSGLDPRAALEPSIVVDPTTFPQLVTVATVEAPLAGPTSEELAQRVGSATVMPIGVDVEDFVARIEFINPSDATDRPWDFGIAFREQENGDHYRLTVASDGTWEFQIGLQADLAGGTVPALSFEDGGRNVLEIVVAGDSAGFSVNDVFVSELNVSELHGASDVWAGAGFHQANAHDGEITRFENFTVWSLETAELTAAAATPVALATPVAPATPVAQATPMMPAATPVAGAVSDQEVALRLGERDDSRIDALAILSEREGQTTITVVARDASGGEVVVIHEGTCDDASTVPTFLLEDLDASGRSVTVIDAPLADLTSSAHSISIHHSAESYADVLACGDIPGEE
ncbi:MAG TPA: hypothetical protein VFY70_05515 [Thermomicrobiales bacterium]|nr:hypothetical protein [Thermomicrobiales bacterium]